MDDRLHSRCGGKLRVEIWVTRESDGYSAQVTTVHPSPGNDEVRVEFN